MYELAANEVISFWYIQLLFCFICLRFSPEINPLQESDRLQILFVVREAGHI